jgi:GntR family transcriptional regulator/MocR family aminotransferase
MPKPDWQPDTPLYLQLYQRYREAITSGRLRPGERVPSIRNLASELHVARGTVEMAYQMLVSEGYLVTKGAAGTGFPSTGEVTECRKSVTTTQNRRYAALSGAPDGDYFTVSARCTGAGRVPRKIWSRLAGQTLRMIETTVMNQPDPAGYAPLRKPSPPIWGFLVVSPARRSRCLLPSAIRGA